MEGGPKATGYACVASTALQPCRLAGLQAARPEPLTGLAQAVEPVLAFALLAFAPAAAHRSQLAGTYLPLEGLTLPLA